MKLSEINSRIIRCRKCPLWKESRNAVPGEGPVKAKAILIGQNPGREEDATGRPFVGRSGKFLDAILKKNGVDRKKLFITSVVKHKTSKNRKPNSEEIKACMPWLTKQIAIIKPKVIVLMGNVAKQVERRKGITYIETCHPAAAMRFPKMRIKFERDIKKLRKLL